MFANKYDDNPKGIGGHATQCKGSKTEVKNEETLDDVEYQGHLMVYTCIRPVWDKHYQSNPLQQVVANISIRLDES